jgi:hypothetical protein
MYAEEQRAGVFKNSVVGGDKVTGGETICEVRGFVIICVIRTNKMHNFTVMF